jgi:hypothetical protein
MALMKHFETATKSNIDDLRTVENTKFSYDISKKTAWMRRPISTGTAVGLAHEQGFSDSQPVKG